VFVKKKVTLASLLLHVTVVTDSRQVATLDSELLCSFCRRNW